MRTLMLIAMLSLLTACASNPSIKTSGDIQGQQTIRVVGNGVTQDDAKRNGFRNAIEIVVGSALVSEKESINDKLRKDDIIEHSAGYVDDFKIISSNSSNLGVSVVMDVTVKNSVIASKLLNRNEPTNINGTRLDTQYKTYMDERKTGDVFLNSVLKDYPNKAFVITQGKVDFMLNGQRETVFVIPYKIRWDYKYIQALNEALSKVQDLNSNKYFDPRCICYISPERVTVMAKDPKAWLVGSTDTYHFNDSVRANDIAQSLQVKPYMKLTFVSHAGTILQKDCVGTQTMFAAKYGKGLFEVWGNAHEDENIHVVVKRGTVLYNNMDSLSRIEMSMETFDSCRR